MALTALSVASVRSQPPLLLFSVSALSSATGVLAQTATVVDHFLDAQDIEVANLSATNGSGRFAQAQTWIRLESGETVHNGVRAWVRCEVAESVQAGKFTVYVARAVESHFERDVTPGKAGDALFYHNLTWHRLGAYSVAARGKSK